MSQIADNQLIETLDLFTVIQSFWNGMVPLLVGMMGKFRTMVLVLQKWSCLHHCKQWEVYISSVTSSEWPGHHRIIRNCQPSPSGLATADRAHHQMTRTARSWKGLTGSTVPIRWRSPCYRLLSRCQRNVLYRFPINQYSFDKSCQIQLKTAKYWDVYTLHSIK